MQPKAEELKFVTKNDGYVHIHPSSVNYQVRIFIFSLQTNCFIKTKIAFPWTDEKWGTLLKLKKKMLNDYLPVDK